MQLSGGASFYHKNIRQVPLQSPSSDLLALGPGPIHKSVSTCPCQSAQPFQKPSSQPCGDKGPPMSSSSRPPFNPSHPRTSLVAQLVKNWPTMQDTQVRSLGWEDPLEKGMATYCSILTWEIPWTEQPEGYSPWGHKESDTTEWLNHHHPTTLGLTPTYQ